MVLAAVDDDCTELMEGVGCRMTTGEATRGFIRTAHIPVFILLYVVRTVAPQEICKRFLDFEGKHVSSLA